MDHACQIANIYDFIMGLEHQYNAIGLFIHYSSSCSSLHMKLNSLSLCGGHTLSGGQRQRLSIARAILKNTPILILDEASSNIDNINERLIREALVRVCKDRTTIIIAHRLSNVMNADSIFVFADGMLMQQGKHSQLLKDKQGLYFKVYMQQREENSTSTQDSP